MTKIQQHTDLLIDLLSLPVDSIAYATGQRLQALEAGRRTVIETGSMLFDFEGFAQAGHCAISDKPELHTQRVLWWHPDYPVTRLIENGWVIIHWQGYELEVVKLAWQAGPYSRETRCWVIAGTQEIAEQFIAAACEWSHTIREELLVFMDGCWQKDRELYGAVQRAEWDDLILADELKAEIRDDLLHFLSSERLYARYGVAWKRGVLLMGPPGNGKTFCLMGLIKLLKLPCLYVRSFKTDYGSEEHNIREVFRRARESTPCLLVLEDLDALVNDGNRAFFLNEVDGFVLNEGLITITTTNHPEQLDPAILERPSRFDRRYTFALPADGERRRYLELWNRKIQSDMQIEPETIQTFVEQTSGFSFATLKELILSSMMAWIEHRSRPMAEIIGQQIDLLR